MTLAGLEGSHGRLASMAESFWMACDEQLWGILLALCYDKTSLWTEERCTVRVQSLRDARSSKLRVKSRGRMTSSQVELPIYGLNFPRPVLMTALFSPCIDSASTHICVAPQLLVLACRPIDIGTLARVCGMTGRETCGSRPRLCISRFTSLKPLTLALFLRFAAESVTEWYLLAACSPERAKLLAFA